MRLRNVKRLAFLPLVLLVLFSASLAYGYSYQLYIQPIQVGDQAGHWADSAKQLYQDAMQKIWDQAGIKITFESWNTFDSSTYYTLDPGTEFYSLTHDPDHGQNANSRVINMWFVNNIVSDPGYVTFGIAWLPGNGIVIADATFTYNSPYGRIDTMAHELGHNLGLGHDDYGAGGANNLMTTGSDRTVPNTIADINPDGRDLDQLLTAQIGQAITTGTLENFLYPIPLPGTVVLLGSGLGFLVFWRRR